MHNYLVCNLLFFFIYLGSNISIPVQCTEYNVIRVIHLAMRAKHLLPAAGAPHNIINGMLIVHKHRVHKIREQPQLTSLMTGVSAKCV